MSLGALGQKDRRLRIVLMTGVFEFMVPLIGLWLGQRASSTVADQASWLGPALLAGLGIWAIWSAGRSRRKKREMTDRVTTFGGLILLDLGLSVDNLVVGFSLGLSEAEPLLIASTIAAFSMAFTWTGLTVGNATSRAWEQRTAVGAGVLLLGLAAATWAGVV